MHLKLNNSLLKIKSFKTDVRRSLLILNIVIIKIFDARFPNNQKNHEFLQTKIAMFPVIWESLKKVNLRSF